MNAVKPVNAFYGAVSWPVLHQIAAEKHIDALHSPAYTQDRLVESRKMCQQLQFQRVPFRLQISAGCVFLAVTQDSMSPPPGSSKQSQSAGRLPKQGIPPARSTASA